MRVIATALLALVATVVASPSFGPDLDEDARLSRRSSLEKRGVSKIMIVSSPSEARAYKKHTSKFRFSTNYGDKASSVDDKLLKGLSYAPMIDLYQSHSSWTKRAKKAIKTGARFILGPNEPNEHGQSGKQGAKQWKRDILPLLRRYKNVKGIVGGVSGAPNGVTYMREFRKHCKNCRIAGYGAHIYTKAGRSQSTNLKKLKQYIKDCAKATNNGKLYITEFGSRDKSQSKKISWIKKAMKFFRKSNHVAAAAAFPHLRGGAFVSHGKLTKLGKAWVSSKQ